MDTILPSSWRLVILEEIAAPVPNAIVDGPFGSNLKLDDYVDRGIPVLQGKNITNDTFRWCNVRFISKRKADELKRSTVHVGDILIVKIGSIGYSAVLNDLNGFDHAIIPANLAKITPDLKKIDLRYLHRWLTSLNAKRYFLRVASKTAQPALSLGKIKSLPVPLPPLPEQRRIAKILDKADALRAKRRAALAQLDTLTQSIFLEMFGDPATNPKGWPVRSVSEYVAEFQGGKSIEAESGEGVVTRNRVLKISAVTGMKYLPEESKPVPDSYEPPSEHYVRAGDLLFSRANTTDLVGAVAIVDTTPSNLLLPDKLWRFVWRKPIFVEKVFVWALFQTPKIRFEIARRATGTSGSMKNISKAKVLGIQTILPPIAAQKAFARHVNKVERIKDTHRKSLAELNALFASLKHRAFRGEL